MICRVQQYPSGFDLFFQYIKAHKYLYNNIRCYDTTQQHPSGLAPGPRYGPIPSRALEGSE